MRDLRQQQESEAGSGADRLAGQLCGERFPTIDLLHVDLAGCEHCPDQPCIVSDGVGFEPPFAMKALRRASIFPEAGLQRLMRHMPLRIPQAQSSSHLAGR